MFGKYSKIKTFTFPGWHFSNSISKITSQQINNENIILVTQIIDIYLFYNIYWRVQWYTIIFRI